MVDLTNVIPAGAQERTRQLQYFEQSTFRNTQITADYRNVGVVQSFSPTMNVQHQVTRVVGSRHKYADRKLMKEGTFQLSYQMLDTVVPRYGVLDPNGTGTIDKPLSFLETALINGATRYRMFNDCFTETITFAFEKDFNVTQNMYSAEVTKWLTESQLETRLGITGGSDITDYFAPALSGQPWNHLDHETTITNTGSPMTINGDLFLFTAMNVEVNNNLRRMDPSGYDETKVVRAGNLVITGSVTLYLGDGVVMEDHVVNFDTCTIDLKIKENTNNDVHMILGGVNFNSFSDTIEAGSNTFSMIEYPFEASTIALTANP